MRIIIPSIPILICCFVILNFVTPVSVTVYVDGKFINLHTTQQTVEDALKKAGIKLYPTDIVKPGLQTKIKDGLNIRIYRIQKKIETYTKNIPYTTWFEYNHSIPRGKERIKQRGKEGIEKITMEMLYIDDVLVSLKKHRYVLRQPVNKIIVAGGKRLSKTKTKFKVKKVLNMLATAYSDHVQSCGKWAGYPTPIGIKARYGVAAVDPRVIPLRTKLYIEGYGYAIAGDVGGAIKGRRIDLCFNTHREAVYYGRKRVKVYILE